MFNRKEYHTILEPNKRIQSALLSSTTRFSGTYSSKDLSITHAFSPLIDARGVASLSENPIGRNSFVITFLTEERDSTAPPNYNNYLELVQEITSYISVLFGKRFDSHGLVHSDGLIFMPSVEQYQQLYLPKLNHNSHEPRNDIPIPLHLSEIEKVSPLFLEIPWNDKSRVSLRTACRFYLQGLQLYEHQPESAYLSFVTSGEVLAKHYSYSKEELLDEEIKTVLDTISKCIDNSGDIVKKIKDRIFQIKKRYVITLLRLINDSFFLNDDELHGGFPIKKENLEKCLNASYDLRSLRVHQGSSFQQWISHAFRGSEVLPGTPVSESKALSKTLSVAPTLSGIERIMRFALLSFMQESGLNIDDKLKNEY